MMSPIAVSRLVAWSRSCRDGVTGGLRCKSQDPGITLQLIISRIAFVVKHLLRRAYRIAKTNQRSFPQSYCVRSAPQIG
jgi:hypothetical protein